jgi:cell division protein FtsB
MDDKAKVLEQTGSEIVTRKGISRRFLMSMLMVFGIAWMLLFPKIYLQNTIYYESRDIATLQREYETLKEENRVIKRRVEAMKFKNQVLDTLFAEETP